MNIEEIKKEIITIKDQMLKEYTIDLTNDKTREFYYIQCLDMVLRIIEEHSNQPDYKSAWNELFNFYAIDLKDMYSKNDVMVLGRLKELKKKYNLGGE